MMNYAQVTEQIEQLKIGNKSVDTESILEKFYEIKADVKFAKILFIPNVYEKDSIGEYLEAILKEHKFTVGRFTSFAIKRHCGHIFVNGKPISQKEFASMGEAVLNLEEPMTQTDIIFWIALYYFAEKNCDYIILPTENSSVVEMEQPLKNETQNVECAEHILKECGIDLNEKIIQKALQKCKREGKFEVLRTKPYFIADGADNEASVKILMANLQYSYPNNPYIFIVGCLQGESEGIVKASALLAQQIITVTPPEMQNAMSAMDLAKEYSKLNLNITNASSMEEAVEIANIFVGKDTVVVGFGTTAILDKFKKVLNKK